MASISEVTKAIQAVAQNCMHEWQQKPSSTCDSVTFRCFFVEGPRREGVSQPFFQHIHNILKNMTCWTPQEASQPWNYFVTYEMACDSLEKDVLSKNKHNAKTTIECDAKGSHAILRFSYHDVPSIQIGIGPYASFLVNTEKHSETGQYIKKDTNFSKIIVEARKTFTFHEHFDWVYTLRVRFREPYFDTSDLVKDVVEKDLTFRDPPSYHVDISCPGHSETTDTAYFADSFLCKIADLLPGPWRLAPLHLKSKPTSSTRHPLPLAPLPHRSEASSAASAAQSVAEAAETL